ncbi:MAG: DNA repair protein RadC [Clostridiales bacterium]|nr:DNA repair protein RadC [Clostridiales bacterium]
MCYTHRMEKQAEGQHHPHHGHRARLRARFMKSGLTGFAPHEALELLLTFAIPRQDVNPIAHQLLARFGSFNRVLQASAADLQSVKGIGEGAATLISLMLPLFRVYREGLVNEVTDVSTPESLILRCQALLMGERVERFMVLSLDARGRLITHAMVSTGDEGETAVYPRLIAQELLRAGASACVLAHNHPSGLAQPSSADVQMTKALKDILSPLSIRLQDHIIIAGEDTFSFAAHQQI